MPYTYEFPRPAVTVDVVLFTIRAGEISVLLIRRAQAPFKGQWALPGGFVEPSETLERAALRELHEETNLGAVPLVQLGAFGDPGRDPRGHTVSVAYFAFLVAPSRPVAGDDAAAAQWMPLRSIPEADAPPRTRGAVRLAFDHRRIVAAAHARLKERLQGPAHPALLELVPQRFTLSELQHVYEAVVGKQMDKRNFRSRLLMRKLVEPVAAARRTGRHRPAQLYRWVGGAREQEAAPAAPPAKTRGHARAARPKAVPAAPKRSRSPATRGRARAGKRVR